MVEGLRIQLFMSIFQFEYQQAQLEAEIENLSWKVSIYAFVYLTVSLSYIIIRKFELEGEYSRLHLSICVDVIHYLYHYLYHLSIDVC